MGKIEEKVKSLREAFPQLDESEAKRLLEDAKGSLPKASELALDNEKWRVAPLPKKRKVIEIDTEEKGTFKKGYDGADDFKMYPERKQRSRVKYDRNTETNLKPDHNNVVTIAASVIKVSNDAKVANGVSFADMAKKIKPSPEVIAVERAKEELTQMEEIAREAAALAESIAFAEAVAAVEAAAAAEAVAAAEAAELLVALSQIPDEEVTVSRSPPKKPSKKPKKKFREVPPQPNLYVCEFEKQMAITSFPSNVDENVDKSVIFSGTPGILPKPTPRIHTEASYVNAFAAQSSRQPTSISELGLRPNNYTGLQHRPPSQPQHQWQRESFGWTGQAQRPGPSQTHRYYNGPPHAPVGNDYRQQQSQQPHNDSNEMVQTAYNAMRQQPGFWGTN